MKNIPFACALLIMIAFHGMAYSQIEDELDRQFLQDDGSGESAPVAGITPLAAPGWEIYGYLQNDNHFGVAGETRASDFEIIKLEARGKITARYGTDAFYGKSVLNAFFYPAEENEGDTDSVTPHDGGAIEAQELYIGGGTKFRYKIGKQRYSWGTGDAFQVTNYLDQPDLREFFAVDDDDKYQGVYSISLKYLIGDFAVEGAAVPFHDRPLLPEGYWGLEPVEMQGYLVEISDDETSERDLGNSSFAVRAGGTLGIIDFHAGYFNGISNNLIFKPEIDDRGAVLLKPCYKRIQTIGLDLSFNIYKLAVRAEGAYSPDMPAVINPEESENPMTALSAPAEDEPCLAYVVGADYNLWGANGLVLIEWMQSKYLKNGDKYLDPFMTDLYLVRVQDKFLSERLEAEVNGLIRPVQSKPGYGIMYEIGWNFQNGMTVSTGGLFFTGHGDDLIRYLDNKDMVYIRGRMTF